MVQKAAQEMLDLVKTATTVQEICLQQQWRFCFIGGIAVQYWAEPRLTRDVDLTLITGFGDEEKYAEVLLQHFESRISDPIKFSLQSRVLLLRHSNGIGVDIAFGALPFEESAVARARDLEVVDGYPLRLCSAEDLIVFKSFAGRGNDWRDVEMTIVRQGESKLDWNYITRQLRPLVELKGAPELLTHLEELRVKIREDRV